ncbi:daxx-like protein isoform X3 [Colias croceus]|uniref:daxx-like protein isoform X3 n=1 Tax=Colias crocea TaxID=72248 RepID=UPI001E280D23|nr:daxx-like protein isoform X3 [Colias croceus]
MSNEDVIELGSSDEEKEPAPKKKKTIPNAMVRIPNPYAKLPGLTIKPSKKAPEKSQKLDLNKKNINASIKLPQQLVNSNVRETARISANMQCLLAKKQGLSCIPIKMCKPIRPANSTTNVANKATISNKTKIKGIIPGRMLLNNLPPSITIKRTNDSPTRNISQLGKQSQKKMKTKKHSPQVLQTVEIDDEDVPVASTSVPQWYKRPEEEDDGVSLKTDTSLEKVESLEEQNNKEPEPNRYIEITIEDSPIKPAQSKHTGEASNAITIEDSPIKAFVNKDENNPTLNSKQDKNSKKKLDYPHEIPIENNGMVEIEIQPMEENDVIKINHEYRANKTKPSNLNDQRKTESRETDSRQDKEFNATYQKFIDTCFHIENSDDMKKIVEKKIKAYYRQCSKEFVDSEEFTDLVSGKILAIEASPDKMYLYIKDVVDELNMQRKMTKANIKNEDDYEDSNEDTMDRSEYDTKRQRQIRKLEKTLKKLHRAIQKLEEQEVDFDDDDDSVYLLTERYKERLVKVHAKFCQLTNTKMPSEPSIKLEVRPGRPSGPVRKVEKLINVKVPIGAPLPFPDFHDVLRCVREANQEDKLGWSEMEIIEEARSIFTSCGKKLQRRRQENEWRIAASRLPTTEDPAEKDEDLKNILQKNKEVAAKKESEVFNKYADRQIQLKLEAVEIGDKEADESPIESEEDDDADSTLLKDKEKRKSRLKRLIQEKSKLVNERSKEVVPKNVEDDQEKSDQIECDKGKSDHVDDGGSGSNVQKEKDNEIINSDSEPKDNDDNELQTISEDNNIESDVDELHLLQKLYSENEANSSEVDSESESPISLSDSDNENPRGDAERSTLYAMDVISIENSSYSDSENTLEDANNKHFEVSIENKVEELSNINEVEMLSGDCNNIQKQTTTDNCNGENIKNMTHAEDATQEHNDIVTQPEQILLSPEAEEANENILLGSSDDDDHIVNDKEVEACVNLGDDNISISETCIGILTPNENNIEDKEKGLIQNDKNENLVPPLCSDEIEKSDSNVENTNIKIDQEDLAMPPLCSDEIEKSDSNVENTNTKIDQEDLAMPPLCSDEIEKSDSNVENTNTKIDQEDLAMPPLCSDEIEKSDSNVENTNTKIDQEDLAMSVTENI